MGHDEAAVRRWLWASVRAVAPHPALYVTALRQALVLVPSGWWRSWPPAPVPDARYLAFRLQTAYGDDGRPPPADDVVAYLRWCRQWRTLARDRGRPGVDAAGRLGSAAW